MKNFKELIGYEKIFVFSSFPFDDNNGSQGR